MEKTKANTSQKPEESDHVKKAQISDQGLWIGRDFFPWTKDLILTCLNPLVLKRTGWWVGLFFLLQKLQ